MSSSDTDATADALIRQMMVAQKREVSRDALPDLEPDKGTAKAAPVKHPRKLFKKRKKKVADDTPAPSVSATAKPPGKIRRRLVALLASIGNYRPTGKHAFFAVVAAIIYLRPWLIPITLFVAFWVVLIAYFSLGPDRVAELVVSAWQRLHARRPELAETIRQRAEAMAERIDAALDRLPGSWSDQIHVPDFSRNQGIAPDSPDPFERLAKEFQ